jgi:hypothetical protein
MKQIAATPASARYLSLFISSHRYRKGSHPLPLRGSSSHDTMSVLFCTQVHNHLKNLSKHQPKAAVNSIAKTLQNVPRKAPTITPVPTRAAPPTFPARRTPAQYRLLKGLGGRTSVRAGAQTVSFIDQSPTVFWWHTLQRMSRS